MRSDAPDLDPQTKRAQRARPPAATRLAPFAAGQVLDESSGRRGRLKTERPYAAADRQAIATAAHSGANGVPDECSAAVTCDATQEHKLTASDAAANDQFGVSVSVSGDVAVVGAFLDDCAAGGNCGAAYVYRFDGSTWLEE